MSDSGRLQTQSRLDESDDDKMKGSVRINRGGRLFLPQMEPMVSMIPSIEPSDSARHQLEVTRSRGPGKVHVCIGRPASTSHVIDIPSITIYATVE
jgi:hypothetical protein